MKSSRVVFALVLGLVPVVAGCNDLPKYWADLGVTKNGGKLMADAASDTFLVVVHENADPSTLIDTCTKAYAPIVEKGFTPAQPTPVGGPAKVDQILSQGSDKISITCNYLADTKAITVTLRHR